MSKLFYLGLDTGGTHTDAVIYDPAGKSVVASAKALTTHQDLSIGIAEALANLSKLPWEGGFQAIERINLSTTLATNAIAEGLSNPVGLFLMGYDQEQVTVKTMVSELPLTLPVFLAGSHDYYGREDEVLDEEAVIQTIGNLDKQVSAWAVSGFFSVKNPAHEMRVAELIKERSEKPVTMGRDLTGNLNAVRRAVTAALNAGLVVTINRLLDAVTKAARGVNLKAPLMVVKGDGSLVSEDWARKKPIETVVSGPAAGLVGARLLTHGFLEAHEKDLWVIDVGGTTTDLALIKGGLPAVNANGAKVGCWETMALAVDTRTKGLGGDSFVGLDGQADISIGPRRVLPLCRLAVSCPEIVSILETQRNFMVSANWAGVFFMPGTPPTPGMSVDEEAILKGFKEKTPYPLADYAADAKETGRNFSGIKALKHPAVMISAFTPTDAMSILGLYNQGNRQAAVIGAEFLGRIHGFSAEMVARMVLDEFGRLLAQEILSHELVCNDVEMDPIMFRPKGVFGAALGRRSKGRISMVLEIEDPVVLLGAPVNVLAPFLEKYIKGRILVPPIFDVASAVGAAASPIHLVRRVEIQTMPNFSGYRLFLPHKMFDGHTVDQLVQVASDEMDGYMRQLAMMAGTDNPDIDFVREDQKVNLNDGSRLFLGSILTFTATCGSRH